MNNNLSLLFASAVNVNINEKNTPKIIDVANSMEMAQVVFVPGFALYQSSSGDKLTINQNQIVLEGGTIGNKVKADGMALAYQKLFSDVFEMNLGSTSVRLTSVERFGKNEFDHSLKFISNNVSEGLFGDEVGVGLRLIIGSAGNYREFKVEPYIADSNNLYFEGLFSMQSLPCGRVVEYYNECVDDFLSRKGKFFHIFNR